jgi:SAM-dependent methyltransferase
MSFEELVAEGAAVPLEGWDFSWFEGRATEERPPWGYATLVAERMSSATAALDIETGGGEVLATVPSLPSLLVATESWPPNIGIARNRLRARGVFVVAVSDSPTLPFVEAAFDLVVSRHPVVVLWEEITRVLEPGGRYLSQQVGAGSNRALTEFMMGRQPVNLARSPEHAVAAAERAGLEVLDLRECRLRVEFFDVGAVVHFLRKVHWTVPGFTAEDYEERLRALHEQIERNGSFVSHAQRFLIEAGRPRDAGSRRAGFSWPGSPSSC